MYVDGSGKCPDCQTNLHTCLRVIAHLSDPRRNLPCRNALAGGTFEPLPEEHVATLDAKDRIERRAARRAGRTHPGGHQCSHTGRRAQMRPSRYALAPVLPLPSLPPLLVSFFNLGVL